MKNHRLKPTDALNMPFKNYDTKVITTIYDVVYKEELYNVVIHHKPHQNIIEIGTTDNLLFWEETENVISLTTMKKYVIYTTKKDDLNEITEQELNSIEFIRQSYEVTSTIKGKHTYYVSYLPFKNLMNVELWTPTGKLIYRREYDGTINKSQAKQEVIKYLKHEKRDAKAS